MDCNLEQHGDGYWYCTTCNGLRLNVNAKRNCKGYGPKPKPKPKPIDAAKWMAKKHAKEQSTAGCYMLPLPDLLARVELCRAADCDKLQDDVCTMLGSTACKQRSNWFAQLVGGASCVNWNPK